MSSVLLVLKKAHKLGHAGIVHPSVDLSKPDLKKKKKEWTEAIRNLRYHINA